MAKPQNDKDKAIDIIVKAVAVGISGMRGTRCTASMPVSPHENKPIQAQLTTDDTL